MCRNGARRTHLSSRGVWYLLVACSVCKALGRPGDDHNKRTCKTANQIHNLEKGGGRPVEHIYDQLFAELEKPPTGALELVRWAQRICALSLWATAQGKGSSKRNSEMVQMVRAIVSLTPKDTLYEATELLKRDAKEISRRAKPSEPLSSPVGASTPLR